VPRGPRGEKRPADVIGAAIMVAKIATFHHGATRPNWDAHGDELDAIAA
jgi:hypothetical protein